MRTSKINRIELEAGEAVEIAFAGSYVRLHANPDVVDHNSAPFEVEVSRGISGFSGTDSQGNFFGLDAEEIVLDRLRFIIW